MDSRTQGLKDSRTQGLKDSRTQGLKYSRTQGLKDSRTQGLKDSRTQGLKDSRTQEEPTVSHRGPHRSILEYLSAGVLEFFYLKEVHHAYGTLYLPIRAAI